MASRGKQKDAAIRRIARGVLEQVEDCQDAGTTLRLSRCVCIDAIVTKIRALEQRAFERGFVVGKKVRRGE